MKKLLFAFAALTACTGWAFAAPPVPVANWTGCYIGAGGGYGLWNQDTTAYDEPPRVAVRTRLTNAITFGGRGWFGTVEGGCDYQFSSRYIIGAFGDYDFTNIHGHRRDLALFTAINGNEKLSSQWAVGGRVGWLVTPSLLTYFSGGYTEAHFDRQNFDGLFLTQTTPPTAYIDGQTYQGWFLGGGVEFALSFLPGFYWKTEYRYSQFDAESYSYLFVANGQPTGWGEDAKKYVQTVRTELVYRFNWGHR